MRRVVVTGLGMLTPLAAGVEQTWDKLISGKSGIRRVVGFDVDDLPVKIAGQIPRTDDLSGFNPDDILEIKEQRKIDDFILYAIAAADEALSDSGWKAITEKDNLRAGVLIGSGIGGLQSIAKANETLNVKGPRRMSPFFIPSCLINLASGQVSIKYGLDNI